MVRIGLIGYGLSGAVFHAPLIGSVSRLELTAVASSRREAIARDLPAVRVVAAASEIFSDPALDLVVVASPTWLHFEHARAALEAGKHVVVDKPFTATAEQARQLIELAAGRGRILTVFQNRRWDNDFLTIQDLIREGRLGCIFSYEAHYDRFRPAIKAGWREEELPGSSLLHDLGAHLIDQALVLFGKPHAVYGDVLAQRDAARVADYFHLILEYGRMRAILHASTLVAGPGPHFAVHGDSGSFLKYGMDSQEEALKAGARPGSPGWGADAAENYGVLVSATGERRTVETLPGAYERFYEGVSAAVLDGAPAPVDAQDSLEGLRIIDAALQSSREKRTIT